MNTHAGALPMNGNAEAASTPLPTARKVCEAITVRMRWAIVPLPKWLWRASDARRWARRSARSRSSSSISGTSGGCDMSMAVVSGLRFAGSLRDCQMAGYLVGGDGLVVEPALNLVAARGANHRGLCLGLYTLSGYEHVHGASDGDTGNHHRPAAAVVGR